MNYWKILLGFIFVICGFILFIIFFKSRTPKEENEEGDLSIDKIIEYKAYFGSICLIIIGIILIINELN